MYHNTSCQVHRSTDSLAIPSAYRVTGMESCIGDDAFMDDTLNMDIVVRGLIERYNSSGK